MRIRSFGIFCVAAGLAAHCFGGTVLFYGGDFDVTNPDANALANETDGNYGGSPYGAAVYQDFVIPIGQTWTITDLFSNDLMSYDDSTAYYEIRSGISEGDGGTLLASGDESATMDDTGLNGFDYEIYNVDVSGLDIVLGAGTYWFTVVPDGGDQDGRSFTANTFGINSVGMSISDMQFFNSSDFGANYTNADNEGVFSNFSMGVMGSVGSAPEPATAGLVAVALAGLYFRRRSS